ncbi:hypothetical protein Y032_0001g438 [Ancylostoma ceylanicum]|uniref:1-alkyl-2-acetylglycerophosphocholine esterase n=1 Tax=Ancylostoma ceylanicum TaxID=53326 RepID=A0A016W4C4_9BILA|nr:hypothetical protein Y032_0001g438 [Ancylostoma ceylanicum]
MGAVWSYAGRYSVLPLPGSGNYRTGCADLMITDTKDGDTGVFMRVFYPVDRNDFGRASTVSEHPHWLSRPEYVNGLATYMKQSAGRLQFIFNWLIGETRSAALWQHPLAGSAHSFSRGSSQSLKDASFPVVIFSHGLSGCRHFYSTFCASLASHGFIVGAVEHSDYSACWTYKLYPDPISGRNKERQFQIRLVDKDDKRMFKIRNQQLNKRVSECVKALHVLEEINLGQLQFDNVAVGKDMDWSQFKGRLDLSRAFVAGHSFGGATAVAATAFSTDFQAAVVMDGWLYPLESGHYERASQPTLFLNAGKWQYAENLERMAKLRNVAEKPMFTLRDAEHQTFTDFPFLVNSFIGRRMKLHGETPPETSMEAIVDIAVSFLNREQDADVELTRLVQEKYQSFIVNGFPSHLMNSKPNHL